ncbi:MAG: ISNCY family transposase, partial [Anaerolineae bacterium]|nr:ISNCY family transposase [Anaerolineae bacterium]
VVEVVKAGRTRWKSENENNNVLKTKGYHLEHNFGHGKQYLASFLLTLNLLAFLFHTVLELADDQYRLLRQALGARQPFFNDIRALTRYLCFESWSQLLTFMILQLELHPVPDTG